MFWVYIILGEKRRRKIYAISGIEFIKKHILRSLKDLWCLALKNISLSLRMIKECPKVWFSSDWLEEAGILTIGAQAAPSNGNFDSLHRHTYKCNLSKFPIILAINAIYVIRCWLVLTSLNWSFCCCNARGFLECHGLNRERGVI